MDWSSFRPDQIFKAPNYTETRAVQRIHGFFRQGYPKEFAFIASENYIDQESYIFGLISFASVLILILIVWDLLLIIFSCIVCCGSRNKERNVNMEKKLYGFYDFERSQNVKKNRSKLRSFFIIGSLCMIMFSIVIFVVGVMPMRSIFIKIRNQVLTMEMHAGASYNQVSRHYTESMEMSLKRDIHLESINNWCTPIATNLSVALNELSTNPNSADIVNFEVDENYVVEVDILRKALSNSYEELSNFVTDGLETLEETLRQTTNNVQDAKNIVSGVILGYSISEQIIIVICIINGILQSFLIVVYLLDLTKRTNRSSCIRKSCIHRRLYSILPLFAFSMNILWILSALFLVAATISADVCTGSPDNNTIKLIQTQEEGMNFLLYDLSMYYVKNCMSSPVLHDLKPTRFIDEFILALDKAYRMSDIFVVELTKVKQSSVDSSCGGNIIELTSDITEFSTVLRDLKSVSIKSSQSLYCDVYTPLYVNIMHDEICHRSVQSLGLFFTMVLMSAIVGMIMVTVAVYHKNELNEKTSSDELSPSTQDELQFQEFDIIDMHVPEKERNSIKGQRRELFRNNDEHLDTGTPATSISKYEEDPESADKKIEVAKRTLFSQASHTDAPITTSTNHQDELQCPLTESVSKSTKENQELTNDIPNYSKPKNGKHEIKSMKLPLSRNYDHQSEPRSITTSKPNPSPGIKHAYQASIISGSSHEEDIELDSVGSKIVEENSKAAGANEKEDAPSEGSHAVADLDLYVTNHLLSILSSSDSITIKSNQSDKNLMTPNESISRNSQGFKFAKATNTQLQQTLAETNDQEQSDSKEAQNYEHRERRFYVTRHLSQLSSSETNASKSNNSGENEMGSKESRDSRDPHKLNLEKSKTSLRQSLSSTKMKTVKDDSSELQQSYLSNSNLRTLSLQSSSSSRMSTIKMDAETQLKQSYLSDMSLYYEASEPKSVSSKFSTGTIHPDEQETSLKKDDNIPYESDISQYFGTMKQQDMTKNLQGMKHKVQPPKSYKSNVSKHYEELDLDILDLSTPSQPTSTRVLGKFT